MTGYCKYCGTLTNDIVKVYDKGRLIWVGCRNCREKQNRRKEARKIKNPILRALASRRR